MFPFSSEFDAVRRRFVLEKTVASVNFHFRAKIADGTVDAETADRLLLCVCVRVCNVFPQITNYLQMIQRVKKNVAEATRVYYRWKSMLE